jgi:hypothetical protein
MEAAEEAAMARDSSSARARELESEVTALTERLASVRKVGVWLMAWALGGVAYGIAGQMPGCAQGPSTRSPLFPKAGCLLLSLVLPSLWLQPCPVLRPCIP